MKKREDDDRGHSAHETSGLAKNTRKRVNDFHHRIKTVDQLAISVSKVFEFVRLSFEQVKDVVRRMARSELVNKGMFDRVDPDLLDIVRESCIEEGLK